MALIRANKASVSGIVALAWCDYRSSNGYSGVIEPNKKATSDGTLITGDIFEVERTGGSNCSIKALVAGDYEVCASATSGDLTFTTVTATAGQTIATGTSVIAYKMA